MVRTAARSCTTLLAGLALGLLVVPRAEASSVSAFASCFVSNVNNSQQASATPGVPATASLSSPTACASSAVADYGVLKVSTDLITGVGYSGNASAQFLINFSLTDPTLPAFTPITLAVPVNYHVMMGVTPGGIGGSSNSADFSMFLDSNVSPFYLYHVATSTDVYGGNVCPAPQPSLPACNGLHQGTVTAYLNTYINGGLQRLWITANAAASVNTLGSAFVDAMNTVTLGNILLPNGVSYAYDSGIAAGTNPANFTYAVTPPPGPAPVPEPSSWMLMTGGLGLLLAACRRRRT
jgi:hypothetical protein